MQANFILAAAVCLISSGCSSMTLPSGNMSLFGKTTAEPEVESEGAYEILLKPKIGSGQKKIGQLTEPKTVEELLDEAGIIKKYRAMDITIYRKVKNSPVPLKMEVAYSSQKKSIRPEQNYAIRPGDQILFQEKTAGSIGKILDGLTKF